MMEITSIGKRILAEMKIAPDRECYNAALRLCVESEDAKGLKDYFDKLCEIGEPDADSFASLAFGYYKVRGGSAPLF